MTDRSMAREEVKDLLPDWIAGRLTEPRAGQVERVVATDEELAAEARFLRRVAAARPEPPADLTERIVQAVHDDALISASGARTSAAGRRLVTVGWLARSAVAAAALVVLALGIERWGVPGAGRAPLDQLALEDTSSPWVAEDGFVAGAPVLDDLSDEALASLLEELGG